MGPARSRQTNNAAIDPGRLGSLSIGIHLLRKPAIND